MMAVGKKIKETALELINGRVEKAMLVNGRWVRNMDKENLLYQLERFMKDSGWMIKDLVKE